jgi:hypothetical protein
MDFQPLIIASVISSVSDTCINNSHELVQIVAPNQGTRIQHGRQALHRRDS